jgi:hypothetical protein
MAAGTSSGQRRTRTPGGRAVRVVVRVTAEEYATLAAHADNAGLTVPSYLATLGLHPDQVPIAELRSALTHAAALRRLLSATASASARHPTETPDAATALAKLRQQAQGTVTRLDAFTTGHR